MSNTDQATDPTTGEPARKQIADRDWINDAGEVVAEELATGVRYTFLGRTKDGVTLPGDGKSYTLYFRDLTPEAAKMLAGFGAITLMGNVTNTWMSDKSAERPALACEAIEARFATIQAGKWRERGTGGGGQAIDRDKLATAIVELAAEKGQTKDYAAVRAKLEEDSAMRIARGVPEIAARYAQLVGRATKSLDDVLGGF